MARKKKKTDIFSAGFMWLAVVCCIAFAVPFAFRILVNYDLFADEKLAAQFFESFRVNNILLWIHIVTALPPLILGPFLFHEQLRNNHLRLHRNMGKIYIIGCLVSAATGLLLALGKKVVLARFGFATLACLWFMTTFLAYRAVRRRDFIEHRKWMLRSFSLTFAFFTVKMWVLGLAWLFPEMDALTALAIRSWTAWVPNLIIIDLYIILTTHRGKFIGWAAVKEKWAALRRKDKNPSAAQPASADR